MNPSTAIEEGSHPEQPQRSWLARRLSSENPFYLLSAACVIHSTGLSIGGELPLMTLLSLIGGYLLLLAFTSIAIVKLWKVWDDARSIFLTLVFLMFELALCFDQQLSTGDPLGIAGLITATAAALLLSELVIRILKIQLPWIYRGPFYVQLTLAMIASLIPMSVLGASATTVRWSIYGVSVLAGLSMLTLIPAIRTGRERVESSVCPWIWPYHPWSLFVIVWVAIGFRVYLLTISFDPALELSSAAAYQGLGGIFGGYLIAPMLLGMAVLSIEGTIIHRNAFLQTLGLALPILCVGISVQLGNSNAAFIHFQHEFTNLLGTPVWVATISALVIHYYAWLRGVLFARRCIVVTLLMLCRITPATVNWQTTGPVHLGWLAAVCVFLLMIAFQRRQLRFAIEGCVWLILALGARQYFVGWEMTSVEIQVHLIALIVAVATIWMSSTHREEVIPVVMTFIVIASFRVLTQSVLGIRPPFFGVTYLVAMTAAAYLIQLTHREYRLLGVVYAIAIFTYISLLVESSRFLGNRVHWSGLYQFLVGLGLLHIGVLVSAWKGGFFRRFMIHPEVIQGDSIETP